MPRVRIIKKNDEYSSEYDLGDIFDITGTWYGGVHIEGKSGVPVSLDKDEYMELDTEPQEQKNPAAGDVPERDILVGDIVQHFKREWVSPETSEYPRFSGATLLQFYFFKSVFLPDLWIFFPIHLTHKHIIRSGTYLERRIHPLINDQLLSRLRMLRKCQNLI